MSYKVYYAHSVVRTLSLFSDWVRTQHLDHMRNVGEDPQQRTQPFRELGSEGMEDHPSLRIAENILLADGTCMATWVRIDERRKEMSVEAVSLDTSAPDSDM